MDSTDSPLICDERQIGVVLRVMAQSYGSIAAMARLCGVDGGNLRKAIIGERRPSPRVLSRMGITKKLSYESRVSEMTRNRRESAEMP